MKAKKFNYEKHGPQLIELVERNNKSRTYKFWFRISSKLALRLDCVARRSEQWRRIYYTAKRKQKVQERNKKTVSDMGTMLKIRHKNVDIADQLSEINRKLDALSGLINVCLPLRHRVVL